jgi:CheY-like chemotaxis protein
MDSARPTILIVEDDEGCAELLARELEEVPGRQFDCVHCSTAEKGLDALSRPEVFLAFVDYRLGAWDGVELVEAIRASGDQRMLIAMTAAGFDHIAQRFKRAGADGYLTKDDLRMEKLQPLIEQAWKRYRRSNC